MDELNAKLIAGTEDNPQQPFFSPDGKWIGYFSAADGKLKKIGVSGGAPVVLCDVYMPAGASWGADNTIVYAQIPGDIMRISANGGTPESIIKAKSGLLLFPQILPAGKALLYTAAASLSIDQTRIMVQSLESGEPKELFAGANARYLPTGHIVYQLANRNSNNLFAIPFDLEKQAVAGGPVSIAEGVFSEGVGMMQYAISESGTLVYMPGVARAAGSGRSLMWVNREGKEEALHTPPDIYRTPRISPDGKRVALAISTDGIPQIWIWDLVRETMTRLTFDKWANLRPIWTRDGKRIVFISIRDGKRGIYWKEADGTEEVQKLASALDINLLPYSWSSDGRTLAIEELNSAMTRADIGTLSMEGDHTRKLLLHEEYMEAQPNISPDGKYMAYMSIESGQMEIYVRPFPEANKGKWQISTGGGESPIWSPDGSELFYRNGGAVMAVPVDTRSTIKAGKPRMLFQGRYLTGYAETPAYDISPDGKRFLMIKLPGSSEAGGTLHKINIAVNWFEELKQRVPKK